MPTPTTTSDGPTTARKKWDEAIVCYQKAIKLNPKHRSAYFNLQATVQNKGSDEHIRSSVEILDDILKGDP